MGSGFGFQVRVWFGFGCVGLARESGSEFRLGDMSCIAVVVGCCVPVLGGGVGIFFKEIFYFIYRLHFSFIREK